MQPFRIWLLAARPRTLPASLAPLLLGNWLAYLDNTFFAGLMIASLVCAVALQILVNFANDYFDALSGVDTDARIGPQRATQSGLVSHGAMRLAMVLCALVAVASGLYLVVAGSVWLLPVGFCCLLAAYGYSGGPYPLASLGLGEVTVFLFFGLVAVCGSYFMHTGVVSTQAWLGSFIAGLPIAAIMLVNNIRDIDTDSEAGKRTLPVRIGRTAAKWLYGIALTLPLLFMMVKISEAYWWLGFLSVSIGLGFMLIKSMFQLAPAQLNPLIGRTSLYSLWTALLGCIYFSI
ncbi:1,4-dihydroxy-2-naphthoate polyprenyltransferase [Corallincola platygyrae]|uniref:1,4-dihydroxy-2-naphthoate octaprenyltransferase n=1 Tax=Corallincola platygyrae TaxID=1193278 RepID=A0ABW4XH68_9GAMM